MDEMQQRGNKNTGTIIAIAIVVILVILAFVFGIFDRGGVDVVNEPDTPNGEVDDLPEGLDIEILSQGDGAVAQEGDLVSVHVVGRLPDGSVFLDTYESGEPVEFLLGAGQVMEGWDAGVVGMREGEVRELTLAPELVSGNSQFQNLPENTSVVFEIELIEVSEPNGGKG